MTETWFTDEDLKRVVEAERLANAQGTAEFTLRCAGHAMTERKRAALDILYQTRGQHPTVYDILARLQEQHPSASVKPVRLMLYVLEHSSLLKVRRYGRSPKRYDTRLDAHLDVLCTACGAIEEFEVDTAAGAVEGETRKGVCRGCSDALALTGAA